MIIALPSYNDCENLKQMIESLYESTDGVEKILIVDSSDDGTDEYYNNVLKYDDKIEFIKVPKEGPLKALDYIMKIIKERKEDVLLTQTDVIFKNKKRDWLTDVKTIAQREDCGIVTCWGGGGISGPEFINGFRWVGTWFCYIPYKTIERIGTHDINIPLGWGVDIDYSYAVINSGLYIYCVDYWVEHIPNYEEGHEHEQRPDIEKLKKDAFKYMRKKWNLI